MNLQYMMIKYRGQRDPPSLLRASRNQEKPSGLMDLATNVILGAIGINYDQPIEDFCDVSCSAGWITTTHGARKQGPDILSDENIRILLVGSSPMVGIATLEYVIP